MQSQKTTSVILITGFLGSGKTTFLKRIIDSFPKDRKLTVLMNEFGEIGIDGLLIEDDDIHLLEISRGSIFCVCVKTDFIKALHSLHQKIQPDLLVIESTGVANPADLKRDLQLPIFSERFDFADQFCIIDAMHFVEAYEVYASVEKQLETSSIFIINKTDLVEAKALEQVRSLINKHVEFPVIFETTYSDIPLSNLPSLSLASSHNNNETAAANTLSASPTELEAICKTIIEDPERQSTPPDNLVSVVYAWCGDNLDNIRGIAGRLPEGIARAKGVVEVEGVRYLFNYVMGEWTLTPYNRKISENKISHYKNCIVFIGESAALEVLNTVLTASEWTAREVAQPFQQTLQPL